MTTTKVTFFNLFLMLSVGVFAGATPSADAAAAGSSRGEYLAEHGYIVPPDEVKIDQYIASIDYGYPIPESGIGVYVYTGNRTISPTGGRELVHIGVKGSKVEFDQLPPLNLAFVIDNSGSMAEERKLEWVKDAFDVFLDRVRPVDFVSLVIFNSRAETLFRSTRMDSEEVREQFKRAVQSIEPGGGTNLNAGLVRGYQEVQQNYRTDYTNRVLFLTDGMGDADRTLELARTHRYLGINVSTIGVGDQFDAELMTQIAAEGGGSSRFISDPEEMQEIFGDELDRMIVPAARNVQLRLLLSPGITMDETWGYRHEIDGPEITYTMPTVHNWDYETILLRLNCPASIPGSVREFGTLTVSYDTLDGGHVDLAPVEISASVSEHDQPLSGVSTYRVIQSSAMLEFAEAMKEIGTIFYADSSGDQVDRATVSEALERTRQAKAALVSARRRIDNIGFEDELAILENYFETLGRYAEMSPSDLSEFSDDVSLAISHPTRTTIDHLSNMFREIAVHLEVPGMTVAVAPFFIRTNVLYPDAFNDGMRAYIQNVSTTVLASESGMLLVDTGQIEHELSILGLGYDDLRDTIRALEVAERLGTDAIVTGNMLEMTDSFVLFARVIHGETEQVLAAAQVVMDKDMVLDDLLGPSDS